MTGVPGRLLVVAAENEFPHRDNNCIVPWSYSRYYNVENSHCCFDLGYIFVHCTVLTGFVHKRLKEPTKIKRV